MDKLTEMINRWNEENVKTLTQSMCQGEIPDDYMQQFLLMLANKGVAESKELCEEVAKFFEIMRVRLEPFDPKTNSAFNYGVISGAIHIVNVLRSRHEEIEEFKALSETEKKVLMFINDQGSAYGKEVQLLIKGDAYRMLSRLTKFNFLHVRKIGNRNYYELTLKAERCLNIEKISLRVD